MSVIDLRNKSEKELKVLMEELQDKLRVLRFDLKAGKIKNVRLLHQTRKDIARGLTILKEKSHESSQ